MCEVLGTTRNDSGLYTVWLRALHFILQGSYACWFHPVFRNATSIGHILLPSSIKLHAQHCQPIRAHHRRLDLEMLRDVGARRAAPGNCWHAQCHGWSSFLWICGRGRQDTTVQDVEVFQKRRSAGQTDPGRQWPTPGYAPNICRVTFDASLPVYKTD